MTTKRRKLLAFVLLAVIAGMIAYGLLTQRDEPKYQGRYLSEWITRYRVARDASAERNEATAAVQAIGTNALPSLLKWTLSKPPAWRTTLGNKLPAFIRNRAAVRKWINPDAYQLRRYHACSGFEILGSNAVSAIPELVAMTKRTKSSDDTLAAAAALAYIGPPAIPALKALLADPNQRNRDQVVYALFWTMPSNVFVPIFIEALNDNDIEVRSALTNMIWEIAPQLLTNAPVK